FEQVRQRCDTRETELRTYSASTAVRSALLAAEFFVGSGPSTGPKAETTVAFARRPQEVRPEMLLGLQWLERWKRSGAKFPDQLPESEREEFEQKVLSHPQFSEQSS